jgi:capsular exopolysaccharide synthesis family protein
MPDETDGLIERAAALLRRPGSPRPESRVGGARPQSRDAPSLPTVSESREVPNLAREVPVVEIPYSQPPVKEVKPLGAARRHWRLILVLAVGGALAAFVACEIITPLYTATATVIIDPHEEHQRAVGAETAATLPAEQEEAVRRNQISLMRSRPLVEAVVSKFGLAGDAEFNPLLRPPSPVKVAIDRGRHLFFEVTSALGLIWEPVHEKPTAQQVLNRTVDLFLTRLKTIGPEASRVIEIGFTSQDPVRAAGMANSVAEKFIEDQVAQQVARAQSAMQALQKQIAALNLEIRDAEGKIEKIRSQKGLLPNSDLVVASRQMEALNGALTDAEVAKVAAEHEPPWTLNRETSIGRAAARVAALQRKVAAAKGEMARATAAQVDVGTFDREIKANQALMEQLVARLDRAAALTGSITPDVRLVTPAIVPEVPSFPPKLAAVGTAFLFCLTGGTVLAVLLEHRDRSIRSTAQLRQASPAPILGAMPALNRIGGLRRSPIAHVVTQPRSMFAENLRAIWFQVGHGVQPGATTLVVTSALSREGKTSIAVSLARMLALGGRSAVVVDADLRYPRVHRALGLKRGPGLADLLAGSLEIDRCLQQDAASGAFCIAAGRAAASPADLLHSPKTAEVLGDLSARFEAVIIDTPPVLGVHDAAIVARLADMTVMVVRWGVTKEETFITAMQRLHDLRISVDGVILSRVNIRKYTRYGAPDEDAFGPSLRKYYTG